MERKDRQAVAALDSMRDPSRSVTEAGEPDSRVEARGRRRQRKEYDSPHEQERKRREREDRDQKRDRDERDHHVPGKTLRAKRH